MWLMVLWLYLVCLCLESIWSAERALVASSLLFISPTMVPVLSPMTSDIASPLPSTLTLIKPSIANILRGKACDKTPSCPVILHNRRGDLYRHETLRSRVVSGDARRKVSFLSPTLPLVGFLLLLLCVLLLLVSLLPLLLLLVIRVLLQLLLNSVHFISAWWWEGGCRVQSPQN